MTWMDSSIMKTRGVAGRKEGTTHHLTEAKQGKYHYTMGPYSDPVLHIEPGDRIVVETRDAFEGAIKTEHDKVTQKCTMPFLNPQNGPIMIKGAEKGDAVAVYIESIGTLSCSPEIDSISSLTPDNHGGNMDLPDMGPGSITYLPVRSPGGRLFIGDAHACQGDGEICGVAVEYATVTTIRVDLIKAWKIEWPRLENEEVIMTIGSTRPLEDATRIAYRELIYWMERDYGFNKWDAYMMLSQCGKVRLGNVVDPKYTVGAAISKKYLAKK